MAKTTLLHLTPTGKVAFKAEMPGKMNKKQIRRECKKWCVPLKGLIVKYS